MDIILVVAVVATILLGIADRIVARRLLHIMEADIAYYENALEEAEEALVSTKTERDFYIEMIDKGRIKFVNG